MLKSITVSSVLALLSLATTACAAPPQNTAVPVPADCLSMDLSPYSAPENLTVNTVAGARVFTVEVASNEGTREQGLMCRSQLADNQGMLFEFQDAYERTFWMKDTLIGLDIIYIAPDGRIVSIQKNAKPLDRTPLPSRGAASGVLEVRAGLSDELGMKPGDKVIHPFFH